MPVHEPNTLPTLLSLAGVVLPIAPRVLPNHHPRIAHLMRGLFPYLFSDSLHATVVARWLHYPWVDKNAQVDADHTVWIVHWSDLWKAGYRWRWTGQHDARGREIRERIPASDRHLLHIEQCNTLTVSRLRTSRRGGSRPHTAEEHMAKCVANGRKLALELKGTFNHAPLAVYVGLAEASARTGCVTVLMTLQSIAGWRIRVGRALEAQWGGALALLPRSRRPADWSHYADQGVAVWGHWRR